MSVPDNMKFVIFALMMLLPVVASAQQDAYELDAWFWHRHLSTRDSLFTQDYDNDEHKDFIPLHLSAEDFNTLDSAADALGFWSMPDTIPAYGPAKEIEMMSPGGWQNYFYFKTPRHPHHKVLASRMVTGSEKLYAWETVILKVMYRQQYYSTLPKPMKR
jgi:hypothetical protein